MEWAGLLLVAFIGLVVFRRFWRPSEPRRMFAGPIVNGRNQSRGCFRGGRFRFGRTLLGRRELHALTRATGPLEGVIHTRIRITGDEFYPPEMPGALPVFALYFQRAGDNWSGVGMWSAYRWYSRLSWPFEAGDYEIELPLQFDHWKPVNTPDGFSISLFDLAREEAARVGIVCGYIGGRSHGVVGEGELELLKYDVVESGEP